MLLFNIGVKYFSSNFFISLELTQYIEPSQQDRSEMVKYFGEEKIQKMEYLSEITTARDFSPNSISSSNLSIDDRVFLLQMALDYFDYLKYRLNQQVQEIELTFEKIPIVMNDNLLLPHELDMRNNPLEKDIKLNFK